MKVLIIKTSALGDIVHALPVVSYLHNADPTLKIDWLVEEPFAHLLEEYGRLNTIHRINTKLWRQPDRLSDACTGILKICRSLRREKYDVVLDLQGNSKSGLFTFISGGTLRYGFDHAAVREWPNLLATNRRIAISSSDHHITDQALGIASKAFPAGHLRMNPVALSVNNGNRQRTIERMRKLGLADKKVVLIHPGTTWGTKRLSLEFWTEVANSLKEDGGLEVLFSYGSRQELADIERIRGNVTRGFPIWPKGDLKELMALLAQADMVVGGDTGPVHIAAALGTPTVSFYRATERLRNGPRGKKHITLQSNMECSPCLRKKCARESECSNSISVDEALSAIYRLLRGTCKADVPLTECRNLSVG